MLSRVSRARALTEMVHDNVNIKVKTCNTSSLQTCDEKKFSFQEALKTLNSLQTNFSVLKESIAKKNDTDLKHIIETKKYLERVGVEPSEFESLPIIHVAGTKGKGSTCAFIESILRSFGLKTGFFSSPHLVSVTERIRLDGESISQTKFTNYFWYIYNKIYEKRDNSADLPAYFKFLTVMSFYVFLQEKVDVAIYEVGIGGQYDPTNIHSKTPTVGITSLGLEHTKLLGDTLEEIAWQKAGIIKPNSYVFTVDQPDECLEVIRIRADQNKAQLLQVPKFNEYPWQRPINLSIDHDIQKINASLAIQLAYDWIKLHRSILPPSVRSKIEFLENESRGNTLMICEEVINGLENCKWMGRCQFLEFNNLKFYLDGAHTTESIHICIDWFQRKMIDSVNPRCLIFNLTGDREYETILKIIHTRLNFDRVFFVPNISFRKKQIQDDSSNFVNGLSNDEQLNKCKAHEEAWKNVCKYNIKSVHRTRSDTATVLHSISEAIYQIRNEFNKTEVDILVTGSLHLIGATLISIEEIKSVG